MPNWHWIWKLNGESIPNLRSQKRFRLNAQACEIILYVWPSSTHKRSKKDDRFQLICKPHFCEMLFILWLGAPEGGRKKAETMYKETWRRTKINEDKT